MKRSRVQAKYGPFFQIAGDNDDVLSDQVDSEEEEQAMALEMNQKKIDEYKFKIKEMTNKRDTQLANKQRRLKNFYGEEIGFHTKEAKKLDFVITNQML